MCRPNELQVLDQQWDMGDCYCEHFKMNDQADIMCAHIYFILVSTCSHVALKVKFSHVGFSANRGCVISSWKNEP